MLMNDFYRQGQNGLAQCWRGLYASCMLAAVLALFYSCASKPKDGTTAETVVQENDSAAEGSQQLRELEEKAKGAIARAESAGASELSPSLLEAAYLDLHSAQEQDGKKNAAAAQREQYLSAIAKANQAYDESVAKSRQRWLQVIANYEADLDRLNAALYMPSYDARSRKLLMQLRNTIEQQDNEAALGLYQATVPNVDAVVAALAANLDWLDQLRQETAGLMGEAGRQNLRGESAVLERQGRIDYASAMQQRDEGDMPGMEQSLFAARYNLREALRRSGLLNTEGIDRLLRSVQESLERASQRQVVDSDGNLITVQPWQGESYLSQHPLQELSEQQNAGQRRSDQSQLQQPQVSADFFGPIAQAQGQGIALLDFQANFHLVAVTQQTGAEIDRDDSLNSDNSRVGDPFGGTQTSQPDSSRASASPGSSNAQVPSQAPSQPSSAAQTTAGGTPSLSSEAQSLLKQAIASWENGVLSRNDGNLPKAQFYFDESARLVDQYNVQYAILGYYTVRQLVPADCLWRIAGYADIYGDPFQWTRIYQRNRNIIYNPSLIYPGQRFVIPPPKGS